MQRGRYRDTTEGVIAKIEEKAREAKEEQQKGMESGDDFMENPYKHVLTDKEGQMLLTNPRVYKSFHNPNNRYRCIEVHTTQSWKVPDVSTALFQDFGYHTAEFDIPYRERALIDLQGDGDLWMLDTKGEICTLNVLAYDIETTEYESENEDVQDTGRFPIDIIGWAEFQIAYRAKRDMKTGRCVFEFVSGPKWMEPEIHQIVAHNKDEEVANLIKFIELANGADIICGHNIMQFDNKQVYDRLAFLRDDGLIPPDKEDVVEAFLGSREVAGRARTTNIFFIGKMLKCIDIYPLSFDTYFAAKRLYMQEQGTKSGLKALAKQWGYVIPDRVYLDVEHMSIKTPEEEATTLTYNEHDVREQIGITMHLLPDALRLCHLTGMSFNDCMPAGTTKIWDFMTHIRAHQKRRIMPATAAVMNICKEIFHRFGTINPKTKKPWEKVDLAEAARATIGSANPMNPKVMKVLKYGLEAPDYVSYPQLVYNPYSKSVLHAITSAHRCPCKTCAEFAELRFCRCSYCETLRRRFPDGIREADAENQQAFILGELRKAGHKESDAELIAMINDDRGFRNNDNGYHFPGGMTLHPSEVDSEFKMWWGIQIADVGCVHPESIMSVGTAYHYKYTAAKDVQVGDMVSTHVGFQRIVDKRTKRTDTMLYITTDMNNGMVLRITPWHKMPVFDNGKITGKKMASQLTVGDVVLQWDYYFHKITKIESVQESIDVYDFTVENQDEPYFFCDSQLVSNSMYPSNLRAENIGGDTTRFADPLSYVFDGASSIKPRKKSRNKEVYQWVWLKRARADVVNAFMLAVPASDLNKPQYTKLKKEYPFVDSGYLVAIVIDGESGCVSEAMGAVLDVTSWIKQRKNEMTKPGSGATDGQKTQIANAYQSMKGLRNSGSLHPGREIVLNYDSEMVEMSISEFYDKFNVIPYHENIDGVNFEIKHIIDLDWWAPVMEDDGNVVIDQVVNVIRHPYSGPLVHIKTMSGCETIVTPNHSLLTMTHRGLQKIEPEQATDIITFKGTDDKPCYYDPIESVTRFHFDGYVYDLEMDEVHNFFDAGGVLAQNTHGILSAPTVSCRQFSLSGAARITTLGQQVLDDTIADLDKINARKVYGDSVSGDASITYRKNGRIHTTTIKSFWSKRARESDDDMVYHDNNEYIYLDGYETETFTNSGTIQWEPIEFITRHPHDDYLMTFTTESGRSITVTPQHSLFVYRAGPVCIDAKQLTLDDKLIIHDGDFIGSDRISSISTISPRNEPVYDLSIREHHRFFANGIAAKNTDGIYAATSKNAGSVPKIRDILGVPEVKPTMLEPSVFLSTIDRINKKWQARLSYPDYALEPEDHDGMLFVRHKNYIIFDHRKDKKTGQVTGIDIKTKGNNFKASDKAPITMDALKAVLEMVIKKHTIWDNEAAERESVKSDIKAFTREVLSKLDTAGMDIAKFTFRQAIAPIGSYKQNAVHECSKCGGKGGKCEYCAGTGFKLNAYAARSNAIEHLLKLHIRASLVLQCVVCNNPLPFIDAPKKSKSKPLAYMWPVDLANTPEAGGPDINWLREMIFQFIRGGFGFKEWGLKNWVCVQKQMTLDGAYIVKIVPGHKFEADGKAATGGKVIEACPPEIFPSLKIGEPVPDEIADKLLKQLDINEAEIEAGEEGESEPDTKEEDDNNDE